MCRGYIAPEYALQHQVSVKSDVYSFGECHNRFSDMIGIIMWELLTRKMPFGDIESFSVPLLVTRGDRPPLTKEMRMWLLSCS